MIFHCVDLRSQHVVRKGQLVLEREERFGAAAIETLFESLNGFPLALDFLLRGFKQEKHLGVLFK